MINLTDSALNAVQNAISGAAEPVGGLRIMVEAGGCAGYKYMMGLVNEAEPDDTVIERNGVKVFVDMKSHDLLAGTTIDFVVALGRFRLHLRESERNFELLLRKVLRLKSSRQQLRRGMVRTTFREQSVARTYGGSELVSDRDPS